MKNPGPGGKARLSSPLLILISAPSGGGKTTLCQQLLARHPDMVRVVTCTTRPPRPGEIEGRDYYFIDKETFARRIGEGYFLEHATVYGNLYGIPKIEVLAKLRKGNDVLINVDIQGADTVRQRAMEDAELARALVTIFLTPASLAELEQRLRKRDADSPEQLAGRLSKAREEIAQWEKFQYLVISTSIAEDVRLTEAIIEAERLKQSRSTFNWEG